MNDPDSTERADAYAKTLAGQTEVVRATFADLFDMFIAKVAETRLFRWLLVRPRRAVIFAACLFVVAVGIIIEQTVTAL